MIMQMMVKGMDAVMLSCDEATYLITKSEFEKVGCVKRMQLKMHLAGCKFCRRFKIQSEIIDKSLKTLEHIKLDQENSFSKLSPEKKKEMEEMILKHQ